MKIQINGHPIDFTLENETTLPQLVDSLAQWARERDLIFTEAWVDDTRYPVDGMPDKPLENIDTVNCIILSRAELAINSINEATDYCSRVLNFIRDTENGTGVTETDITELKSGVDWLLETTLRIFTMLGINVEELKFRDRTAADIFKEAKEFRSGLSRGGAADGAALNMGCSTLFTEFRDMLRIALLSENMRRTILLSIDSPDTVLAIIEEITHEIADQVKNLEEAAIAYQSGKDAEGSAKIERFLDFIYRYFRICHQVNPLFNVDITEITSGGINLADSNAAMNELLNRMLEALEGNDIITLADILEYEMKPAVESLGPFCNGLFNRLRGGK